MKRALVLVVAATFMLSGCDEKSLDQRVAYRDECESMGGVYYEYHNGWDGDTEVGCTLERQEGS